jgi:hypothetical protein
VIDLGIEAYNKAIEAMHIESKYEDRTNLCCSLSNSDTCIPVVLLRMMWHNNNGYGREENFIKDLENLLQWMHNDNAVQKKARAQMI